MLARLLQACCGCYDELIVVHAGPNKTAPAVREIASYYHGHYLARPHLGYQEYHWPFAWSKAQYDWILRLDVDELPTPSMVEWLQRFRKSASSPKNVSIYTCIWPLWNGRKNLTSRWPRDRIFLFNRNTVRFFAIPEQTPIPDGTCVSIDVVLNHHPHRKSFGFYNVLVRHQAYIWRRIIARSLLRNPTDLPCWRWTEPSWPKGWRQLRSQPLLTGCKRLLKWPVETVGAMIRHGEFPFPGAVYNAGLNYFLLSIDIAFLKFANRLNRFSKGPTL